MAATSFPFRNDLAHFVFFLLKWKQADVLGLTVQVHFVQLRILKCFTPAFLILREHSCFLSFVQYFSSKNSSSFYINKDENLFFFSNK